MANKSGREALRGLEVLTFDLIFEGCTSEQLAWLLRAPLERATDTGKRALAQRLVRAGAWVGGALYGAILQDIQVDPMLSNESGRDALRGIGARTFDLTFEALTSEQWAMLLRSPLELAASKGSRDLAQQLVRAGAEIGGALHGGTRHGHTEIVSDLLESGASLTAKDVTGCTPLHIAALRGETEIVQLLLLREADKNALDNEGMTPMFLAACFGHLDAALALLAAGADVGRRCGGFKTPVIHMAAQTGNVEILRAVIEHGVDVGAVDTHQYTALHAGAHFNKAETIDVLVEAGANIETRDQLDRTPLHHTYRNLSREALLCLLKHGATVNTKNDYLQTPLMLAATRAGGTQGAAEVVEYLLRAGADETPIDREGREASGMIGVEVEEEERLAEDVERVRELLANAPADRAWRRRGYLVLCRAHADRVQQNQMISGTHHTDIARRTRSRAKLARAGGIAGDSTVDEINGGDWGVVVSKVLLLQEEGIFRTIVGYL